MPLLDLRAWNLGQEHVAHDPTHHQLILASCGNTEFEGEDADDRVPVCDVCSVIQHRFAKDSR